MLNQQQQEREKVLVAKKQAHLDDESAPALTKEERHELAGLLKEEQE